LAEIRKDPAPVNWVLCDMPEKGVLFFRSSGNGGADELVTHLTENIPAYGIVRLTEKYDEHEVVKFVLIDWLPSGVPMMQKAGLGVLRGQILSTLGAVHNQLSTADKNDVSSQKLADLISEQSGMKSKVVEGDHSGDHHMIVNQQVVGKEKTKAFTPIKAQRQLTFPDEAGCVAAINDVRNSTTDTNWALFGYVKGSKDQIELVGSGSGGLSEMNDKYMDDGVYYGLYRMVDRIDESDTVKFATFYFVGDSTPHMHKARVGTHRGEIEAFLGQSHISFTASDKKEFAESTVHDKVKTTSGSKSRVKAE